MHDHYWEQLANLDRGETARRAGCARLSESSCFVIRLLNKEFVVDVDARTVCVSGDDCRSQPAGYLEQLCILAYLVNAQDLPLSGKLVNAEKLDAGGFFFRGSHRLAVETLAETFGNNPQSLLGIGPFFDASPGTFGDASIELLVLPRIPITVVVWANDEEFSARASILFDQTASAHLPLDVLYAAASLTIKAIVNSSMTTT